MLYIKKTEPPQELTDFINTSRGVGTFNPPYNSLQTNNPVVSSYAAYTILKRQLHSEQRGLCCYCMKVISLQDSRVEHFLPQSLFIEGHVDYYNLYLACSDSVGYIEERQHCDVRKGNDLIAKFIGCGDSRSINCGDLVRYTHEGFILPQQSSYKSVEKIYENYRSLSIKAKAILVTIELLNLNTPELVEERKKTIDEVVEKISEAGADTAKLETMKREYEEGHSLKFAGVAIYFFKQKLERLSASRPIP